MNIEIVDKFPTPDFPYKVVLIYPVELKYEKIFQNNLLHVFNDLDELIKELELLYRNKNTLKSLKFDSQKEIQSELITENYKNIGKIDSKMNNDIFPYCWVIHRDFNNYIHGKYIKTDYLLELRK